MKTLSLLQPWASLIAIGAKKIETRSWYPPNNYRGPLAIHASKNWPRKVEAIRFTEPFWTVLDKAGYRITGQFPTGAVIATCELLGVFKITDNDLEGIGIEEAFPLPLEPEISFGDYTPGHYAWVLGDVRQIEPIPAKGSLGLWEWQPPEGISHE